MTYNFRAGLTGAVLLIICRLVCAGRIFRNQEKTALYMACLKAVLWFPEKRAGR